MASQGQRRGEMRKASTMANVLDLKELLERTAMKKPNISQTRPVSQSSSLSSQPLFSQSSIFSQTLSSENVNPANDSHNFASQMTSKSQIVSEPTVITTGTQENCSNAKIISMTRQLTLAQKKLKKIQHDRQNVSKGSFG